MFGSARVLANLLGALAAVAYIASAVYVGWTL